MRYYCFVTNKDGVSRVNVGYGLYNLVDEKNNPIYLSIKKIQKINKLVKEIHQSLSYKIHFEKYLPAYYIFYTLFNASKINEIIENLACYLAGIDEDYMKNISLYNNTVHSARNIDNLKLCNKYKKILNRRMGYAMTTECLNNEKCAYKIMFNGR